MSYRNDRNDPSVTLSKKLSKALRHQAVKMGLNIRTDGFVSLNEILRHREFQGYRLDDIKAVVNSNDKKRFEISDINGVEYIRAAQGHTIAAINDEELLTEITDGSLYPICIHGTYEQYIDSIMQNGLNRMKRNHMHFAPGMPADDEVISGMRKSCEVIVCVDVAKAMAAGIKFYVSSNNVILTAGINGVLPPEFISDVRHISRKRKNMIPLPV